VYEDQGSNANEVVMLINDIAPTDDLAKLDGSYQAQAGMVPSVPKILGADGTKLPKVLFAGFTGNPLMAQGAGFFWVIGPDRTLYWCGNEAKDVPPVVQMVLDGRTQTSLQHAVVGRVNDGTKILSTAGHQLQFSVARQGQYEISLFSANGKILRAYRLNCSSGINSAELSGFAPGTYIARVSGDDGVTSRRIVLGN